MSNVPKVALLIETHTGYGRGILRGISRYASLHGPWVSYVPAAELPPIDLSLPQAEKWNGNGIICRIFTPRIARQVLAAGVPVVAMDLSERQLAPDSPLAHVCELCPDSYAAGRIVAEHFLDRGLRHFAFCGFTGQLWSRRRQEGFAARVAEAGFACEVYQQPRRKTEPAWERDRSRLIQWLRSLEYPLGLMACNDHRGRQVLEACLVAGLHVPDQVAVVGADDDTILCELANPPLSSIAFNSEKAGYQAAALLAGLMSGTVGTRQRILADVLAVTTRRSSDIIAIEDRHVVQTLRFIRDHSGILIPVDEAVAHSGIGRRALEIRFKKALGRSIRDEIERVHLSRVKRLLAETELPMTRITQFSGFSSLSYLSRVFHRETGMTMVQYRRHTRPE